MSKSTTLCFPEFILNVPLLYIYPFTLPLLIVIVPLPLLSTVPGIELLFIVIVPYKLYIIKSETFELFLNTLSSIDIFPLLFSTTLLAEVIFPFLIFIVPLSFLIPCSYISISNLSPKSTTPVDEFQIP